MKKLTLFLSFLFVISCTKDPIIYTLTTSANPADGGTVSPSTQQYDEGKTATITATASSEYLFQSWSGATGSSNSTSVVMNSDKSVTANFVKKKYALTTTVEGEGTVTEKVIKAGAATDYNSGTIVELTAVPSGEWVFVEWTGDLTGTENPTQITIDKAKSVTAVFVKKQYPLTMEIEGEGTVSEKVIKVGLATDYNSGTIVELTAESTGDWEFLEWTGDITSTENPVQITIDEAKTVKAKFMRYFDYKVPSHDWENGNRPWMNVYKIIDSLKISDQINNTSFALADFNQDGYIDITVQDNDGDGVPITTWFIINDTKGKYFVDEDFPLNKDIDAISARKTIVGDFNNDGLPDVVRPQGGHDWLGVPTIILSNTDGSFDFKLIGDGPKTQPHTISSGDIDSDGDLDLLFAQAGEQDGFLINDGNANFTWKWISEIIEFSDDSDGYIYPNGKKAPWGFWSSEITDVDKDGFVDLILGGSYKGNSGGAYYHGPAVLWGDGTGKYNSDRSTTLFDSRNLDYAEGNIISLSHDYAVNDIDGDGINDIVIFSECSDIWLYSVVKGLANRKFEDKTKEWLPDPIKSETSNHVWVVMKDIDDNGRIDIVESETHITSSLVGRRKSIRWEWNGSKFDKIN